jgi:formylglycine-generating enzyme required for sulfatase activity
MGRPRVVMGALAALSLLLAAAFGALVALLMSRDEWATAPAGVLLPSATVMSATTTSTVVGSIIDRVGATYVVVPAGDGVAAFGIMRTEVTNSQYRACVEAGVCTVPYKSDYCPYPNQNYAEHPVVCVTREQAQAYAVWVGGALPTETQWLRACQGDDGRTYPWGEAAPDATLVNFGDYDRGTTPAGSYPAGASPYGVLDMAGNAWEWIADGNHVVRGGRIWRRGGRGDLWRSVWGCATTPSQQPRFSCCFPSL